MKKLMFTAVVALSTVGVKAQYGSINAILDKLEERRGINQNLKNADLSDAKFVLMRDFDDHKERDFIVVKGQEATYVEIFDDKKSGESSTNIFTGDYIRTSNNIVSFRFDKLEGKKVSMPITKTLLMTMQKNILYLVDVNTKERWIDEKAIGNK